jgi:hypothetical protein
VERIVGVDVFLGMTFQRPTNLLGLIKNSVDIVLAQASQKEVGDVDLLIAPDLKEFSSTEMRHAPALVEAGYRAAMEALDQGKV